MLTRTSAAPTPPWPRPLGRHAGQYARARALAALSYAQSFVQLDRRYDARRREADARNADAELAAGGPGSLPPAGGVGGGASGGLATMASGAASAAANGGGALPAQLASLERDVQDFLLVLGLATPNVDAVEWNLERTQARAPSALARALPLSPSPPSAAACAAPASCAGLCRLAAPPALGRRRPWPVACVAAPRLPAAHPPLVLPPARTYPRASAAARAPPPRRTACPQVSLRSNADKLKAGVQFYVRGVRLLAQDTGFSLGLLSQAISGQTLTEREARILQRTARDLLTFIPFVIILIIPLSPPG